MSTRQLRDAVQSHKSAAANVAVTATDESANFNGSSVLDASAIQSMLKSHSVGATSSIKNTNSSMIVIGAPRVTSTVNTPSFNNVRESLPEASRAMRMRHQSPDLVLLQAGAQARKNEMVAPKSAEQPTQRKKSSSVMSLL